MNDLVDRDREVPVNKRDLTHVLGLGTRNCCPSLLYFEQNRHSKCTSLVWKCTRVVSTVSV